MRAASRALGFARCAVWGFSGGGPHAVACAALLPDLVGAAATIGSLAPTDAPGFDVLEGMVGVVLQVVGAGLPRTGTNSLKLALERLTGGRCYHMREVSDRPGSAELWQAAAEGRPTDWDALLAGYVAAVDWPASAFWRELAEASPDAPVVLSMRSSAEEWWRSVERTVAVALTRPIDDPVIARGREMGRVIAYRFCPEWPDPAATQAAYERHNAEVRAAIAPGRLVEWRPADGWEPLCAALGVPVPDEPFPRTNDAAGFRTLARLDDPA